MAISAIKAAKRILIVAHSRPDGDAVGSLLALRKVLIRVGKDVSIVAEGPIPKNLRFLNDWGEIKSELHGIKDFIILLNEGAAEVARLSYKLERQSLKIVVSPKKGNFTPQNVNFAYADFHFDLLIILDCAAINLIGELYQKNTEMFYKSETLNIDHHLSNTYFAKVNWVDESASSTSEILVSLIEALESEQGKLMDQEIATALLTGIMTDTNLFRNPSTTSKSLTVTAQLIAAGGNRDKVAKEIFQTRSYSTLKIWGRILSHLDSYPALGIVWSEATKQDLDLTGATEDALTAALNDLLYTTEGAKIVTLFKEMNGSIRVSLRSTEEIDVAQIAAGFGGGGHQRAAGFEMNGVELAEAKKIVLKRLRELMLKTKAPKEDEILLPAADEKGGEKTKTEEVSYF